MNAIAKGTEAGIYPTKITYTTESHKPVVYDSHGNDVSLQFTVNVIAGQLTINRSEGGISITGKAVDEEYDGEAKKIEPVQVSGISGEYKVFYSIVSGNGHDTGREIEPVNDDQQVGRAGVRSVRSARIDEVTADEGEYLYEDLPSFTDVTELEIKAKVKSDNYEDIPPYYIPLTIRPRKAKANSEGATKVYDGKALTNESEVKIDRLVEGQKPTIKITGSQLHAGSSKNTFELSNSGKFKTTNYDITNNYGTLTVTPAPVSISAKNYTKTKGDADPTFEADVAGNIYNNEVTWSLARESGEAVGTYAINVSFLGTSDYNVATKVGTLTIVRRGGGGGNKPSTPSTPGTPGGPGTPGEPGTPGSPVLPTTPTLAALLPTGGVLGAIAGPAGGLTPAAIAGGLLDLDGEVLGIRDEPTAVSEDAAPDDIGDEPDLISDVLGVREDACWIHWLILLLTVIYALYNTIRIGARHHLIKKLDDDETENTQES